MKKANRLVTLYSNSLLPKYLVYRYQYLTLSYYTLVLL